MKAKTGLGGHCPSMRCVLGASLFFSMYVAPGAGWSDEPSPSATAQVAHAEAEQHAEADQELRTSFAEYVAAFNAQDVEALAMKWQPEGVFFDEASGERTVGRDAIAQRFRVLFDQQDDLKLGGRLDSIRWIRPDVAKVTGYAVTIGADDDSLESRFTAILVREDGQWVFDSIEESVSPELPVPEQRLEPLGSLVGRWVDQSEGASTVTSTRWGTNRSFLVRSYFVERGDGQTSQGTQVVGWDPRSQRIRCWMFNSDGSFGDGTWSQRDDGWEVKIRQTLSDGRIAAATQIISVIDQDTLRVQWIGREIEGDLMPSTGPVKVVRVDEGDEVDLSVVE